MFGDHGLGGLLEEGAHGKSPKCLGGNLGDLGGFCKGLIQYVCEGFSRFGWKCRILSEWGGKADFYAMPT